MMCWRHSQLSTRVPRAPGRASTDVPWSTWAMTATFRSARVVGSRGPSCDSTTSSAPDVLMAREKMSVARGAGATRAADAAACRAHMLLAPRTHDLDASTVARATDGAHTPRAAVRRRPHTAEASFVTFMAHDAALTTGVDVSRPPCGDCCLCHNGTKSTVAPGFATDLTSPWMRSRSRLRSAGAAPSLCCCTALFGGLWVSYNSARAMQPARRPTGRAVGEILARG